MNLVTRKVVASVVAALTVGTVGGYAIGDATDTDVDLPDAQVEAPVTNEVVPGDTVHVDPGPPSAASENLVPVSSVPPVPPVPPVHADPPEGGQPVVLPPAVNEPPHTHQNEPGDVTEQDHSDHHWNDRTLTFIDYTGDQYAAALAETVKMWTDVGANVKLAAVDGGETRTDCGTSGTTGDTIPVCLFNPTDSTVGYASWGTDSSGHTVRGAINIKSGLSSSQGSRTVKHEVGHIIAFRHGGGCIMEQSSTTSCATPSDKDKSELTSIYNHCTTGDCAPTTTTDLDQCKKLHTTLHETAQGAYNLGVSSTSINTMNDQLHGAGCSTSDAKTTSETDLQKCKRLHTTLHDTATGAYNTGVSEAAIQDLNTQLHNVGCNA